MRFADGAQGAATVGPDEATAGRSLKRYDDLDATVVSTDPDELDY